jgi:hypothetical protein
VHLHPQRLAHHPRQPATQRLEARGLVVCELGGDRERGRGGLGGDGLGRGEGVRKVCAARSSMSARAWGIGSLRERIAARVSGVIDHEDTNNFVKDAAGSRGNM